MQVAKVRPILYLVGGVAAAGAVATIVAVVALPPGSSNDGTSQISSTQLPVQAGQNPTTLPLASFESAWQMPLRRPLEDAATPSVTENNTPAGTSAPSVRLVGTIVDGQHPRGIFITGLSTVEMKTVGETVGAARILAIDDNSATLLGEAGTITLHREKKPFDPSGESYNAAAPPSSPGSDSKDASE
jgi:hypothetical protein